jgi:hypothetical protein
MSMVDTLRKGLKFLLMSMGISSPDKKGTVAKPPAKPTSQR